MLGASGQLPKRLQQSSREAAKSRSKREYAESICRLGEGRFKKKD
jgi:hypothetical protein